MNFYQKIENWLASLRRKKFTRDNYFRIAEEIEKGLLPVEILKGPYKGTIFIIKNITVIDSYGKAQFDHEIIQKIPGKHDSYYGDKFSRVVGEILLVCLEEAANNFATLRNEVLKDDADDPDYIEEFTQERAISKKSTTTP